MDWEIVPIGTFRWCGGVVNDVLMNLRRLKLVVLLAVVAVGACDTGGLPPAADETPPIESHGAVATPTQPSTPATTRSAPTTAVTSSTEPLSESQQAIRFIWDFDPALGNPDELADALNIAHLYPGMNLPVLLEEGSKAVQAVVLAELAEPHGWSVPMLVEMQEYGMPSGAVESPKPWPDAILIEIEESLTTSANASYGPCAELIIDLNWHNITEQVNQCGNECNWGPVWYAVPEAVMHPVGEFVDDARFEGMITFVSDTGAGDPLLVTVELFDRWTITEQAVPTASPDDEAPNACPSASG